MTDYQPINCDLYDWLEIAARWQLAVTLTRRDGYQWADRIRTIEAREGVEYLLLASASASPIWRPWTSSGRGRRGRYTSPPLPEPHQEKEGQHDVGPPFLHAANARRAQLPARAAIT